MLSRKALVRASLSAIVCSFAGIASAQDNFKSSKFLTYSLESQKSYITSSVIMAGLIASQNTATQGQCINNWAAQHRDEGYAPVVDAMRKYPDDHPTGLILAVLQKACGSLSYGK